MCVCYLNVTTNKSELCTLAFLAHETVATFQSGFQSYKAICSQLPAIFLLDKDFTEIAVLKGEFPETIILLCNLQILKYLKTLISTGLVTGKVNLNM